MKLDATTILAALMLLGAAATTPLWHDVPAAMAPSSYAEKRIAIAFKGIDVGAIAAHMNERFPAGAAVALGPEFSKNDFVKHRVTEGLYPRPVKVDAADPATASLPVAALLVTAPVGHPPYPAAIDVGRYHSNAVFLLEQAPPAPPPAGDPLRLPPPSALTFSVLSFLDSLLGAFGIGALLWLALFRRRITDVVMLPGLFLLLAAVALALKMDVQTWLQIRWQGVFPGFGVVSAIGFAAAAFFFRERLRTSLAPLFAAAVPLENWALAVLALGLLLRQAQLPVELWDARSVWIFLARRVQPHGMLAMSDVLAEATKWSHTDYPLLHPAWMAWFAGYEQPFNERMASAGVAALLVAILWILWRLARQAFGAYPGAMFAAGLALLFSPVVTTVYADGLVALFVTIEVFALAMPDKDGNDVLWWIAALAASMTKTEGVVLAAAAALPFLVFHPYWMRRSWAARVAFAAVVLPAFAHRVWASSVGVNSVTHGVAAGELIANFFPRLVQVLATAPKMWTIEGYMHLRPVLWAGLLGLVTALVALAARRPLDRLTALTVASSLLGVGFAVGSMSGLSGDLAYFVGGAIDRLLLCACALGLMAAMFAMVPLVAGKPMRPVRPATAAAAPPATAPPARKKPRRR